MLISLFSCSMIEWHCSMFIKSQQLAQLFYICCIIKATYRIHLWLSALHTFAYYMQFAYGNILPSPISMSFSIQVKWPFVIRRWHANEHMTPSTQAQSAYSYMDLLTCLNGRLPSCWMERTITGHFNINLRCHIACHSFNLHAVVAVWTHWALTTGTTQLSSIHTNQRLVGDALPPAPTNWPVTGISSFLVKYSGSIVLFRVEIIVLPNIITWICFRISAHIFIVYQYAFVRAPCQISNKNNSK